MSDTEWFEREEKHARATVTANPGTLLAEVSAMKAERYRRAAEVLKCYSANEKGPGNYD